MKTATDAASDLLNALVDMVDMFERHIDGRTGPDDAAARWDNARAAIANAQSQPVCHADSTAYPCRKCQARVPFHSLSWAGLCQSCEDSLA